MHKGDGALGGESATLGQSERTTSVCMFSACLRMKTHASLQNRANRQRCRTPAGDYSDGDSRRDSRYFGISGSTNPSHLARPV